MNRLTLIFARVWVMTTARRGGHRATSRVKGLGLRLTIGNCGRSVVDRCMIEPFSQVGMHYMKGRGPAISVPAFHRLRWRRDNRASVSVAATASWPIDTSSARLSTNINSAARNGRTGRGQVRRPAAWESISITRRERERERSDLMAEGRRLLSPAAIYRCSHRRRAQREAPSVRPTDADVRSLARWPAPRCLAQNKMFDGAETAARM